MCPDKTRHRPTRFGRSCQPHVGCNDWAAFLLAQVVFGLAWSGLFAGMEWGLTDAQIT
jgi:hypothetical protein